MSPAPPSRPPPGPFARWLARRLADLFRVWAATWRVEREGFAEVEAELRAGRGVLAFWHGEQLAIIGLHRHLPTVGMVSRSADGELLAEALSVLGVPTVRGSSSRGGNEAFHEALRVMAQGRFIGIAVDGPRGPRHAVQIGACALAARRGVRLIWCVAQARPRLRLRSWDRFEIPLPWARLRLRYGALPAVDPGDRDAVEAARQELAEAMVAAATT